MESVQWGVVLTMFFVILLLGWPIVGGAIAVPLASPSSSPMDAHTAMEPSQDTILEAEFTVQFDEVPDSVVTGETFTVTGVVENVGDAEDNQTVEFLVDGTVVDSTIVGLSDNESETVSFDYTPTEADGDTLTLQLSTEDATDTVTVQHDAPAEFLIAGIDAPESVASGETIDIDATIENVGGFDDTQSIQLLVDGAVVDSIDVTIEAGETMVVSFSHETTADDVGDLELTIASEDDEDSVTVSVLDRGQFMVEVTDAPEIIGSGDVVPIEATIENVGEIEDTQSIELLVDGSVVDSTSVTLDAGASTEIGLSYETITGDIGDLTLTVASEDDEDSVTISVTEHAQFLVEIDAPAEATIGETIPVTGTIENVGEVTETQDIELLVDGEVVDASALTLEGGAQDTVSFTYEIPEDADTGDTTVTVRSDDTEATSMVAVVEDTADTGLLWYAIIALGILVIVAVVGAYLHNNRQKRQPLTN